MEEENRYYVVKKKALPEVLLKVVEVKRLLESGEAATVNEAAEQVGLSRSSFYKYKDDILPLRDNVRGKTITLISQMTDLPGVLASVLKVIAEYRANILTVHQTVPINGVASLTLSIEVLRESGDISKMLAELEKMEGIHSIKVLARE